jgi:hypothetical protein
MRNDEIHQVYFKANHIFREFFGDKTCNIPDVQDRIAKAVAEGSSKKKFLKNGWEIGFHLMDWHGDAEFLIALSLFPERFTDAEIRQGVLWFLVHAGYHIPKAARLIMVPIRSHFRDKFRDKKNGRKKKRGREGMRT